MPLGSGETRDEHQRRTSRYLIGHVPNCTENDGVLAWVSKANGGVPPFGHSTQLRVFVDPDLLQYDEVWAAAGTWNDNFGANPNDIVRVARGVVTDLKRA
ncbi:MAG: hypothetical protein KJS66_01660 [Acidobacteria bacterium]|nr:hypothetical protein [Acidobacteriota bacterium]